MPIYRVSITLFRYYRPPLLKTETHSINETVIISSGSLSVKNSWCFQFCWMWTYHSIYNKALNRHYLWVSLPYHTVWRHYILRQGWIIFWTILDIVWFHCKNTFALNPLNVEICCVAYEAQSVSGEHNSSCIKYFPSRRITHSPTEVATTKTR